MVLVVGATGVVGGMITRRLLERGDEVRILVRTNSPSEQLAREGRATSAEELIAAGASPAYGDMRHLTSLDAALEGVRAVVSTAISVGRGRRRQRADRGPRRQPEPYRCSAGRGRWSLRFHLGPR